MCWWFHTVVFNHTKCSKTLGICWGLFSAAYLVRYYMYSNTKVYVGLTQDKLKCPCSWACQPGKEYKTSLNQFSFGFKVSLRPWSGVMTIREKNRISQNQNYLMRVHFSLERTLNLLCFRLNLVECTVAMLKLNSLDYRIYCRWKYWFVLQTGALEIYLVIFSWACSFSSKHLLFQITLLMKETISSSTSVRRMSHSVTLVFWDIASSRALPPSCTHR